MAKIAVIGAGYVGLVSAACFAHKGRQVVIVERDEKKLVMLRRGEVPFFEPGLDVLLQEGLAQGRLTFVSTVKEALTQACDVVFLCVGTPSMFDGSVDISAVRIVAAQIGDHINNPLLVVNKSTVPVGSSRFVSNIIHDHMKRRGVSVACEVASNPEFLKEGSAVADSLQPDRVVVGVSSQHASDTLKAIYEPFLSSPDQFLVMTCESSELTKYASNAMLATRISFMNQLARLAEKLDGVDIDDIRRGMSMDKRIGSEFLRAGIGYGGSCFPKDVKGLIDLGKRYGEPMDILQQVDAVNTSQRSWFISRIENHYKETLASKKVTVWGLAFKPNTDDIREAPSLDVITFLCRVGCEVTVYDPVAQNNVIEEYGNIVRYARSCKESLKDADFLVLLTEWPMFVQASLEDFAVLKDKTIFDARNVLNQKELLAHGFTYYGVGRNACKSYDVASTVPEHAHENLNVRQV